MKPIILKKNMTRDNCFIIQQVWDRAFAEDYSGNKNPHTPLKVNYLTNGIVEFWENGVAMDWTIDQILKKNTEDENFLPQMVEKHREIVKEMKELLAKGHLASLDELKTFVGILEKGTRTFITFYFSAMDERTPAALRELAMKVRDEDAFYDDADRIIKQTIEHLYPHTKGLATSVLISELDNPPEQEILRQRFKNCILVVDDVLEIISLEDFASQHPEYKFEFEEVSESEIIKGQVANKGFAKGVVRVLKLKTQVNDLVEGEILVSPMTTPDFVPAMKKAVAIITDEGGITCHAAIVSRELGKPCVIGTKFATQVLKDGMEVEVDADNGIVTIL